MAMVGRKLLTRAIPEPTIDMLYDEHFITWQAAIASRASKPEGVDVLRERLKSIAEFAGEYIGCWATKWHDGCMGDCPACRMMHIIELANPTDEDIASLAHPAPQDVVDDCSKGCKIKRAVQEFSAGVEDGLGQATGGGDE